MKPNFLIIGAPKAATTSLCELLGQHPQVFVSTPKEPRFFSDDEVYRRGWSWYSSLFANAGDRLAVGEGSTSYSLTGIYPNTVSRIVEHLPDVRIIYSVRNPISRVESGWMQLRHAASSNAPPSFHEFMRERPNAVEGSRYWKQITEYRRHVPDERILVLFFEDFIADADSVLAKCFRFLDVDSAVTIPDANAPRNVHSDHYEDRRFVGWVRRLPVFDRVRRRIPLRLRAMLEPIARRRFSSRPRWDAEVRRWFIEQIADDVRTFLGHYGKPPDYWNLDSALPVDRTM